MSAWESGQVGTAILAINPCIEDDLAIVLEKLKNEKYPNIGRIDRTYRLNLLRGNPTTTVKDPVTGMPITTLEIKTFAITHFTEDGHDVKGSLKIVLRNSHIISKQLDGDGKRVLPGHDLMSQIAELFKRPTLEEDRVRKCKEIMADTARRLKEVPEKSALKNEERKARFGIKTEEKAGFRAIQEEATKGLDDIKYKPKKT